MEIVFGLGLGLGLGVMLNHFLVSRPLLKEIGRMRREGFVLSEPTPRQEPSPFEPYREPD